MMLSDVLSKIRVKASRMAARSVTLGDEVEVQQAVR